MAVVLEDVKSGYVSVEVVERDYGVAIDKATMTIDARKTAQLRK